MRLRTSVARHDRRLDASLWFGLDMAITGFMRVFFKKMGIENLRFKPAYNPYTEVGHLGLLSTRLAPVF